MPNLNATASKPPVETTKSSATASASPPPATVAVQIPARKDAVRMWRGVLVMLSEYEKECRARNAPCTSPYNPEHED